jgi:hypothetical protein
LYNHDTHASKNETNTKKMAHYTKISLHRAMLITQANDDAAAEYSLRHDAFQVLSQSGTWHEMYVIVYKSLSDWLLAEWPCTLHTSTVS